MSSVLSHEDDNMDQHNGTSNSFDLYCYSRQVGHRAFVLLIMSYKTYLMLFVSQFTIQHEMKALSSFMSMGFFCDFHARFASVLNII